MDLHDPAGVSGEETGLQRKSTFRRELIQAPNRLVVVLVLLDVVGLSIEEDSRRDTSIRRLQQARHEGTQRVPPPPAEVCF